MDKCYRKHGFPSFSQASFVGSTQSTNHTCQEDTRSDRLQLHLEKLGMTDDQFVNLKAMVQQSAIIPKSTALSCSSRPQKFPTVESNSIAQSS